MAEMLDVYLQVWSDLTGVSTHWLETGEYAIRDSNPEPAVWESGRVVLRLIHGGRVDRPSTVKPRLTLVWGVAS